MNLAEFTALQYNLRTESIKEAGTEGKVGSYFCLLPPFNENTGLAKRLSSTSCTITSSCRTATLDFFFDLAESKVAVFLCSILTSDGVPFRFGKNSFL